jgi:hypothetical protein
MVGPRKDYLISANIYIKVSSKKYAREILINIGMKTIVNIVANSLPLNTST